MKKSFRAAVGALIVAASAFCLDSCYDDSKRWSEIKDINESIEELQTSLNTEVTSLKALIDALEDNVYVTDVTEIKEGDTVTGYTINLSKGQAITIYHGKDGQNGTNGTDGKDGVTPTISVVLIDGVYYWALNGEVLEVEGQKVPVHKDSDTPEFKYEEGVWYISVDGSWSPLVSSSNTGECAFSDVKYDDASVTFVLSDGTEIVLPREAVFSLNITAEPVAVLPGATVKVEYTVTGATETTTVYVLAEGGYTAKVEAAGISEGTIAITAPDPVTDGKVVVLAGDNTKAAMQVLTFEEGALTLITDKYNVSNEGGAVEIPVSTNLPYEVVIPADAEWITYVETKAMREETIVLNVKKNTADKRTATVALTVDGVTVQEITVNQAATSADATFSLEDILGEWIVTNEVTNWSGTSYESCSWIFEVSDDPSKGNVMLTTIFGRSGANVYADFNLYTGTITIQMGQPYPDGNYTNYLAAEGEVSEVQYTFDGETFGNPTANIGYTFTQGSASPIGTYKNISGKREDPNVLKIGQYIYSDGSHSTTVDEGKTLVGIIFWLGDATATDPALKAAFPECTNGLAVSVTQCDSIVWQTNTAYIADWQAENLTEYHTLQADYTYGVAHLEYCLGYNNTQVLKAYNEANPETKADIYDTLVSFAAENPAPEGSSGWYIPSAKETTLLVYGENSNAFIASGTANLQAINAKLTEAGQQRIDNNKPIAASTEIEDTFVHAFQGRYLEKVSKTIETFTLCPIFAF